jgi:four helix bundle protein
MSPHFEGLGAQTFRSLFAWRKVHELVVAVYRYTSALPRTKTNGLPFQMKPAAVSIPANIVEGFQGKSRYPLIPRGI